jgi:hypothetical protein
MRKKLEIDLTAKPTGRCRDNIKVFKSSVIIRPCNGSGG